MPRERASAAGRPTCRSLGVRVTPCPEEQGETQIPAVPAADEVRAARCTEAMLTHRHAPPRGHRRRRLSTARPFRHGSHLKTRHIGIAGCPSTRRVNQSAPMTGGLITLAARQPQPDPTCHRSVQQSPLLPMSGCFLAGRLRQCDELVESPSFSKASHPRVSACPTTC